MDMQRACAGPHGGRPCVLSVCNAAGDPEVIEHWPILACVQADIPAMCLLMEFCGHTAINACPRCCMPGETIGGTVRSDYACLVCRHRGLPTVTGCIIAQSELLHMDLGELAGEMCSVVCGRA